jgi:hypothetical protein
MGLILYLPKRDELGSMLLAVIETVLPDRKVEIYHSIQEFSGRLRKPLVDISVAVLLAASRAELMEMICLEDLLSELRLVLILPDSQPEILKKAHLLHPRFIAATERDYKHLGGVLRKMMDIYDRTH